MHQWLICSRPIVVIELTRVTKSAIGTIFPIFWPSSTISPFWTIVLTISIRVGAKGLSSTSPLTSFAGLTFFRACYLIYRFCNHLCIKTWYKLIIESIFCLKHSIFSYVEESPKQDSQKEVKQMCRLFLLPR